MCTVYTVQYHIEQTTLAQRKRENRTKKHKLPYCVVKSRNQQQQHQQKEATLFAKLVKAVFSESNVGKQSRFRFNFHFHSIWLRRFYTFCLYMNVSMHEPCVGALFAEIFHIFFFCSGFLFFALVVVVYKMTRLRYTYTYNFHRA